MNRPIPDPANLALAEATVGDASDLEAVDRAVAELRRGGAVVMTDGGEGVLVRAAETVDVWPLPFFDGPDLGVRRLVVTGRRAVILGLGQRCRAPWRSSFSAKTRSRPSTFAPATSIPRPKVWPVPPQGITSRWSRSAAWHCGRRDPASGKIARPAPGVGDGAAGE